MNENNRQNTVLLTVIAVATLLVAVIGATFAFFTTTGTTGSTQAVTVNGGKMIISFSGDNSAVLADVPEGMDGFLPSSSVIATKTISIVGENDTALTMPFTVDLVYSNTFSDGALLYKVTDITSTPEANREYSVTLASYSETDGTNHIGTNNPAIAGIEGKTVQNQGTGLTDQTLRLATGYFNAGVDNEPVTLKLEIWFPDTGIAQDEDKTATFTGKIVINADSDTNTSLAGQ